MARLFGLLVGSLAGWFGSLWVCLGSLCGGCRCDVGPGWTGQISGDRVGQKVPCMLFIVPCRPQKYRARQSTYVCCCGAASFCAVLRQYRTERAKKNTPRKFENKTDLSSYELVYILGRS